jgi:hypothetical protein
MTNGKDERGFYWAYVTANYYEAGNKESDFPTNVLPPINLLD